METESILLRVFEVARNNGGYLTIREAIKSCGQMLTQLVESEDATLKRNEGFKKSKRNDSISSDVSNHSSNSNSSSNNDNNNNNAKTNDRMTEAMERKLKSLIRSSERFKLNGNVIFVNCKMDTKSCIISSLTASSRRNSLPGPALDVEEVADTCQQLESKEGKSGVSDVTPGTVKSVVDVKKSIMMSRNPTSHWNIRGDSARLIQKTTRSSNSTLAFEGLSKSLEETMAVAPPSVQMSRSHSLERCDSIDERMRSNLNSKQNSERVPPSYLATPCSFNCTPGNLSWPDLEYISKKYKNSDRLVAIMKNFETDVQMATDRLIKQMRSELDSMLVELHRPADKNIGEGVIFCVEKKWGIVDLGNHDHVFFDMSIMLGNIGDLRNHFHVGEVLGFEAVRAQKSSRANWRAIRVWKLDSQGGQKVGTKHSFEDAFSSKLKISEKAISCLFESGSSKGNSPDASPADGKWKKKTSNAFSKTAYQARVQNPFSAEGSQNSGATGSLSAWGHPPLFARNSFPLKKDEVRLIPMKMLTPPEIKKNANQPAIHHLKPWPVQKVSEQNQRMTSLLQIVNQGPAFRDSGNESGNSSPDTLLRSEKRFDSRQPLSEGHRQPDNEKFCNVHCQTE